MTFWKARAFFPRSGGASAAGGQPLLWQIRLLGGLEATQPWAGGRSVTRFRTRRAALLLARLALQRRRWHSRDELALLLWPDVDDERVGRQSLRQELSSLRHQLEPPGVIEAGSVLLAEPQQVRLGVETVAVDVDAFEALALPGAPGYDPVAAVRQYGGPLLPGFYDDWVLAERERLALLYVGCLRTRAGGEGPEALDAALRWAAEDPCDEEARAAVIRQHLALGRPDLARQQYDAWAEYAKREMGERPSPALRALVADVRPAPSLTTPAAPRVAERAADEACAAAEGAPIPAMPPRLPLPLTRFFGREAEVERVQGWLSSPYTRLITLTGPGGSGKTRLALEAVGTLKEPRAACFVACGEVSEAALLPGAIAAALGLPRGGAMDLLTGVIGHLTAASAPPRRRSIPPPLLILDNLEQIADEAAPIVRTLLQSVPGLVVLVTSRRRLGVEGEQECPVGPLPVPGDLQGSVLRPEALPAALAAVPAVQLFVDRAQKVRPDFALTPRNAAVLGALCDRLEGIPLAVELAAAWAGVLSPAQMLERLERGRRFELLVTRRRDAPARHATMRAAVASSCELLPPDIRRFFYRLAVFRGGWTLEAAEEVCEERQQVLHLLALLGGYALVRTEDTAAEQETVRFRLLETMREFCWEQLEPVEREALARRHAAFYLSRAVAQGEDGVPLRATDAPRWAAGMATDLDNVRAALRLCLEELPPEDAEACRVGSQLAAAMGRFWWLRGYLAEGRRWTDAALRRIPEPGGILESDLYYWAGILAWASIDFEAARAHLDHALAGFRAADSRLGIAMCLNALGIIAINQGEAARAVPLLTESLALHREAANAQGAALALLNLGSAARALGQFEMAQERTAESLKRYESLGDIWGSATARLNQGLLALQERCAAAADSAGGELAPARNDFAAAAEAHLQAAYTQFEAIGERWGCACALFYRAGLRLEEGSRTAALEAARAAADGFREIGNRPSLLRALFLAALAASENGEETRLLVAEVRRLGRECTDALLPAAHAAGAVLLRDGAYFARREGRWETAARLLGAAEAASDETVPCLVEQAEARRTAAAARQALGDTAFASAVAAGRAMTLAQLRECIRAFCSAAS